MKTNVEQLNNEGVKLFLNGNFEEAKRKYEEALNIDPIFATTLNNLGMVSLQEREYKRAESFFRSALKEKESSTYFLNLGHAFANQNSFDLAEENYLKALEYDTKSLMVLKSLGSLYQKRKQFYKSIEIWQEIINLHSLDSQYMILMAKDLIVIKEYNKALRVLQNAIKQEKNQEISWYYIALIHFHLKNFGIAEDSIKKSLSLQPDNTDFRALAAVIYIGFSETNKALEQWDYILNLNENNLKVRIDKAVVTLSKGLINETLKELDIVLKKDPNNEKAMYYKALTLLEINKTIEAINLLKTMIKLDGVLSNQAKKLLNKIK